MTTEKKLPWKERPSANHAGVVLEVVHDERGIGIITCVEIYPREAMTIVELPVFGGSPHPALSRSGVVIS